MSLRFLTAGLVLVVTPAATVSAAPYNASACPAGSDMHSRLIGADPALRALDAQMRELVARVRAETSGVDGETGRPIDPIGAEQEHWSNRVAAGCRNRACLLTSYRQRIADIRQRWAEAQH